MTAVGVIAGAGAMNCCCCWNGFVAPPIMFTGEFPLPNTGRLALRLFGERSMCAPNDDGKPAPPGLRLAYGFMLGALVFGTAMGTARDSGWENGEGCVCGKADGDWYCRGREELAAGAWRETRSSQSGLDTECCGLCTAGCCVCGNGFELAGAAAAGDWRAYGFGERDVVLGGAVTVLADKDEPESPALADRCSPGGAPRPSWLWLGGAGDRDGLREGETLKGAVWERPGREDLD